jgi:hypothetical protein
MNCGCCVIIKKRRLDTDNRQPTDGATATPTGATAAGGRNGDVCDGSHDDDDDDNDSGSGKDGGNGDNDTVVARVIEMGITVPFLFKRVLFLPFVFLTQPAFN